jgi:hypothetical protein
MPREDTPPNLSNTTFGYISLRAESVDPFPLKAPVKQPARLTWQAVLGKNYRSWHIEFHKKSGWLYGLSSRLFYQIRAHLSSNLICVFMGQMAYFP